MSEDQIGQVENALPEGVTVGRIVHFKSATSGPHDQPAAAIITAVWTQGVCDLVVFQSAEVGGIKYTHSVAYDPEARSPRTWRFPPRA